MFANLSTGQVDQTAEANSLLNALAPGGLYGLNYETTTGLTLGLHGGNIRLHGVVTTISDYTGSLAVSTTSYVEAHPDTGAVSKNTTAYTPGHLRIGRAVATATAFTWTDDRVSPASQAGTLQKTLPSDANYTLLAAEADNAIYEISGTLTATRNIVVPLIGKRQFTVYNGTGQSLQFIGPTGTGITVATLKHAIVRSDGTNIVRVTADT